MARIAGVNLPNEKRMEIALRSIYGIGATTAAKILKDANVSADLRAKDLSAEEENRLRNLIESDAYDVEGELRSKIGANIKRLKDIGSYRGTRHARSLPVRGQRTKTNSRTVRGNVRKTVGSGRRSAADKT